MLKTRLKRLLPPRSLLLLRNLVGLWQTRSHSDATKAQAAVGHPDAHWRARIDDALACPDNSHIPRVAHAGQLRNGFIVMHNAIELGALGYYGAGPLNLLVENRGVHEPQEERVFAEVLRCLPDDCTMLELGAYWAFYSLWFATATTRPRCFIIEPSYANLRSGKLNFAHAGRSAVFKQAYVSASDGISNDGTRIVSVDSFCEQQQLAHLTILHSDIQGAEVDMLQGAGLMLSRNAIDYLFISTHGDDVHYHCIDVLRSYGYAIIASADLTDTYSYDGLIAARATAIRLPRAVPISKKGRFSPRATPAATSDALQDGRSACWAGTRDTERPAEAEQGSNGHCGTQGKI